MCIFKRIKKTLLANTDKILAAALPTLNYNFILTAGVKSSINQNNNKRMFKYFSFAQDSSCRQNLINKRKKIIQLSCTSLFKTGTSPSIIFQMQIPITNTQPCG